MPAHIVQLTADDPGVAYETVNGLYGGSGRARWLRPAGPGTLISITDMRVGDLRVATTHTRPTSHLKDQMT